LHSNALQDDAPAWLSENIAGAARWRPRGLVRETLAELATARSWSQNRKADRSDPTLRLARDAGAAGFLTFIQQPALYALVA
jgi:hypothetical protein